MYVVSRSKQELSQMISTIRTDNYSWERIIQKGRVALRKIASVQLNMAANEDLWHIESRSKKLLVLEQRFSALTQRLENLYASMDQYLQDLSKIRDNTHRMLSQTSILKDDEILAQHKIAGKLSITQLTEFLDFLYHRYDAEWEVKDMVAREIQNSRDSSDIAFLVTTWNNCPHAGGTEFIEKFNLFYKRMGRRFV
ncbi:uncharacterized protein LOC6651811 isoform X2 [Drosophila willistoni]|uniref:uncharacterized protein LOC6651811 isoform X2 n=1 Tax=Drosophila willistoni TaxID=7260 RepID=UPI000C26C368|nr:uncharacterized protein LOC6651811 isoform X2 [Drosophila willistoni]XP_046866741.1 uncharacterized protein LOC6651811 isoform X2 [Drosophila willistoni]